MKIRTPFLILLILFLITLSTTGCQAPLPDESSLTVTLVVDGATREITTRGEPLVVDLLRQEGIVLGDLDRVNPPDYNRVTNGMTITIVRVREETIIEQEEISYGIRTVPNDNLPAGETQILELGKTGTAEVTYRITYEDSVETTRSEVRRIILVPPQDEVRMVGSEGDLPTVTVKGTLVYIANGNAWVMRQNSANRRALTTEGKLDSKVFDLSADGRRLLYTRSTDDESSGFNELWAVVDTADLDGKPINLGLQNILYAAWIPGAENHLIYSTAEPRSNWPGWQANNDLWRAKLLPDGSLGQAVQILESASGGLYGWYGTTFAIAPDGISIAWAQPDAIGVLEPVFEALEDGFSEDEEDAAEDGAGEIAEPVEETLQLPDSYVRQTYLTYAPWNAYDFIWVSTPTWSPDTRTFAAAIHGAPLGDELPEDSPIFSLSVFPSSGGYSIDLVDEAGMWAISGYSPEVVNLDGTRAVTIAFLQANTPRDSAYSRYRLVVMDRDGSNSRVVFPSIDQPGILPQITAWSPDGRQIAVVDPGPKGNIVLVDVVTGFAQQITTDGQSSSPRWAP